MNEEFFLMLDELVSDTKIMINRPKGTQHPRNKDFIYMVDYGYLQHTSSMNGQSIEVYRGSLDDKKVCGVLVTVNIAKKESETKLLIGCTDEEKQEILEALNKSDELKAILVNR